MIDNKASNSLISQISDKVLFDLGTVLAEREELERFAIPSKKQLNYSYFYSNTRVYTHVIKIAKGN